MAGSPSRLPTSGTPDSRAVGREPPGGDFARLLEAASEPAAHRLRTLATDDARAAAATRFGGSPSADPAQTQTQTQAQAQAQAQAPDADADADRPPSAGRVVGRPPAPHGPPGMAAGRTGAPRDAGTPRSAPADLAELGRRLFAAWRSRPPKDRWVILLFSLGGLWILASIVDAAFEGADGGTGVLAVLAIVAFLLLRRGPARGRHDASDREA